ncbi:dTMP kinase [Mycoplasma phocimorsus]|uniref:Thymidylate kinase n=1 Tax=Mycoplasma phocimorsus TaxID=3045839 RepID=A0AAJ1PRN7_9MOLU|nr:dTMP kinase [Mycoplasma phocimorsus]MDJ1645601.1 dTMP kinase [Mycoplasma phocimorsus]MDJ1647159.1 dTMP kinase [Mycoplasma phocimorsus]MDJ1647679.1 dTMP kinase [Mycoplasma phocimorsus]MDJ1648223.1 dTMP kinase [Mycoplasma phocimorsus]
MFVTLEGIDGSGKSTVGRLLFKKILSEYPKLRPIFTREPGGFSSPSAEKIREIILDGNTDMSDWTEAILYSAARRIHLDGTIWPALKSNRLIICDRYIDSFYVYQGFGRGLGYDRVKKLTDLTIENTIPDLTLYFNLSFELSRERKFKVDKKELNRMDYEKEEFYKRLIHGYNIVIKDNPERIQVIDASASLKDVVDSCFKAIVKHPKFQQLLELHEQC